MHFSSSSKEIFIKPNAQVKPEIHRKASKRTMKHHGSTFPFKLIQNEWNSTKNQTRISSILGPWIVYNNVKTDALGYETGAYLSMYVVCDDQMYGNKCELPYCTEFDSKVCLINATNDASCNMMNETVVDWSDAVVFFYLEWYLKLGFPYNVDETFSSGGWISPYNIILAQDPDAYNEEQYTPDGDLILDTYILKYLNAPATPYLKMPENCTLFDWDEFSAYLGYEAILHTIQNQALGLTFDEAFDPYYKTCENGDIKPMLPYVNFTFVQGDDANETEKLNVRFEMKMLTYPPKSSPLYWVLPTLQDNGFPISGPYCYEGDENRGYTFDLVFDSVEGTTFGTKMEHSCVGSYECLPTQLQACNCSMAANDNIVFDPVDSTNESVELDTDIFVVIAAAFMTVAVLLSLGYNWYLRRRIREMDEKLGSKEGSLGITTVVVDEDIDDVSVMEPLELRDERNHTF